MTGYNTPYAVLISEDNVETIYQHLPGNSDQFGYPLDAFIGFYMVYRPLGHGYVEIYRSDDFDNIFEFVAGKYWGIDDRFQKIQQRSINPWV